MTIPVEVGKILNNEVEIPHMSRLYTTDGSASDGLRVAIRGATSTGVVPTTCDLQKAVSIGHIRLADESNATVFGYIRINGRTINDNTVPSTSTKVHIGDLGVSSGLEVEKTKRFTLPFISQTTVPADCFQTDIGNRGKLSAPALCLQEVSTLNLKMQMLGLEAKPSSAQ
nr:unnamed protein product [Spirometra erinaceieuropaei]